MIDQDRARVLAKTAVEIQSATGVGNASAIEMASQELLIAVDSVDRASVEYEMRWLVETPRAVR